MKTPARVTLVLYACIFVLPKRGFFIQIENLDAKKLEGNTAGNGMIADHDHTLCQPEQVHLSYGNTASEMVVIWATRGQCSSAVHYAPQPWNLSLEAVGSQTELDRAFNTTFRFIHRAVLKDLSPSVTYYFRPHRKNVIGRGLFYFRSPASGSEDWSPSFLALSEVGTERSQLEYFVTEAQSGTYDAVLFNGDVEDKLVSGDSQRDHAIMSDLEEAAGFVPFMTAAGRKGADKHDSLYLYRNIFSMPGTDHPMPVNKLWYSFDLGPVHIISYSTEVLLEPDSVNAKAQNSWLVNDLIETNKKRDAIPWIIAFGNQPMYCSFGAAEGVDCAQNTSRIRLGLEDIFYFFAVDLVIESLPGAYERTWPQYKGVVITKSYLNPRAPVELIMGSGLDGKEATGKDDGNFTTPSAEDWTAFYLTNLPAGNYGRLLVVNTSHLHWELVSSVDHSTLDSFWIVQDSHGNFSLANLPHNISHQINQTIIAMGGKPGTYDFIIGSTANSMSDGDDWSEYSLWLGLAAVGAVLMVIIGIVAIRSCIRRRRRTRVGRRWREMDRDVAVGGNFYNVASDSDTDDNDFEIDVYNKASKQSSKLLTSY